MKTMRILVSLSMFVMATWILMHFSLMWIFGEVNLFEENLVFRAFETTLFLGLLILGLYVCIKECRSN